MGFLIAFCISFLFLMIGKIPINVIEETLSAMLKLGAFGGFFMAPWAWFRTRKTIRNHGGIEKSARTRQKKSMVLNIPLETAFAKTREVLSLIGGYRIRENREKLTLSAHIAGLCPSLPNRISEYIKPLNSSQTEIMIKSRPLIWFTIMDDGKNYENIENFQNALNNIIDSK